MPSRDARQGRRRLIVATIAVLILFAVDLLSGGAIRSLVRRGGSGVWKIGQSASTAVGVSAVFTSQATLAEENKRLTQQVVELQRDAARASADEAKLSQLAALAHLATSTQTMGMTVPVVSSFNTSPYGTFLIGAGTGQGLQPDALVLAPDGFVIGKISEVSSNQALVTEIFAPRAKFAVVIHNTPLELQGQGGGNAQGDVPSGSSIQVGDTALAPDLGELPIGVVGSIKDSVSSGSDTIFVRVPDDLSSLTFVYVESAHQ